MSDNNDPGLQVDAYYPDGGTGFLAVGDVVTVDNGTWDNGPTSFSYQWQACPSGQALSACTDIAGATGSSYVVQSSDHGERLKANVTAVNTDGAASTYSVSVAAVGAPVVAPGSPASISSGRSTSYADGHTFLSSGDVVTVSPGAWSGDPAFDYQWQDCTADNSGCTEIPGATGASYTAQDSDLGFRLLVLVTGTNGDGSSTSSAETDDAAGVPMLRQDAAQSYLTTDSTRPAWAAEAVYVAPGDTLTAPTSGWDGTALTYDLQWQDCPANGSTTGTCTDIPGATGSSYTVRDSDLGFQLEVTGSVSNAYGTSPDPYHARGFGTSSFYDAVGLPVPIAGQDPAVSTDGDASFLDAGDTLTVSSGGWYGDPTPTIGYQWQDCSSSAVCTDVAGATAASYTLTNADRGSYIRVKVTASNSSGAFPDQGVDYVDPSSHVAVEVGAPVNTAKPEIRNADPDASTPTAIVGDVLSVSDGSWEGIPTFTYTWARCVDSTCATVATGASYAVTDADVGHSLRATVTGTNGVDRATADATWQVFVLSPSSGGTGTSSSGGATSSGGGGTTSSGDGTPSGGGTPAPTTSSTGPTVAPSTVAAEATPGTAGSVEVASPSGTRTTVTWESTSFDQPVVVNVTQSRAYVDGVPLFSPLVSLTMTTEEGGAVTTMQEPLDLTFWGSNPPTVLPSFSEDGIDFTSMPQLSSPELPAGFRDGWFRDPDGTVHILTLHATYFGLLDPSTKTHPELTAKVRVPRTIHSVSANGLTLTVSPSLPGRLHLVLRQGGRVFGQKVAHVRTGRTVMRLPWTKERVPDGRYVLTVVLQAGKSTFVQRATLRVSR